MIEQNTKENINKMIIRILTMVIFISVVCMFFISDEVSAKVSSEIEEELTSKSIANYTVDVEDEEEVSNTLKDLILTINSEGMNKNLLSQTINLYIQLTESYSNEDIVNFIEKNKSEFKANNVQMDNVNSVITLLKTVNTEQLNKILGQVDLDEISNKIENGEGIQSIIKDITGNFTAVEKVNFVMDILLSAEAIKIAMIIFVILFIYRTLLRCVIYKKADKNAWAPFVPIYRNIVMLKICGMSPWWVLLLFVPVVGWTILFLVSVASKFMLAESFGKGTGFAFGLWLLAPIFESIIVFSKKTKYVGFEE